MIFFDIISNFKIVSINIVLIFTIVNWHNKCKITKKTRDKLNFYKKKGSKKWLYLNYLINIVLEKIKIW